jgi:hypothetical protein
LFVQQAICARYGQDISCINHVTQGLLVWATTYIHVPVTLDEILLLPWLQAYDLMRPILATNLSAFNLTVLDNFTRGFITATDATSGTASDLFKVMRYTLRVFASVILNDQTEIATSKGLLEAIAPLSLLSDGTTYDFNWRDSLGQHQRGLGYWIQIVLQTPSMISESIFRRIEGCINFMRPYVNGSITKIEFQNSQSSGDASAKAAALAWMNTTSYTFLLQVDIAFPSVYAWTILSTAIPRTSTSINNVLFSAWRLYYASNPLFILGSTPVIINGTSQLIWGNITAANLSVQMDRVISLALTTAQDLFPAVPVIVYEGVLPTDPAYIAARAATIKIPGLLPVAICARYALRTSCINSAMQGLLVWATTYIPTGNPIDENLLIPWIQAYDLMRPMITNASQVFILDSFLRQLVARGDVYPNPPVPDNHISWRFATRALSSVVLDDNTLIVSSRELIDQHLLYNLFSDGTGFDFKSRDAMYYHVYNLEALMLIVLQAPKVLTPVGLALIEAALNFIRLYYEGTLQHIEFLNSPIMFDYIRREAGLADFQNVPWVPSKANNLLEESRVAYPSVNAWAYVVPASTYSVTLLTVGAWALHYAANPLVYNVSLPDLTSAPATTPIDPMAGITTTSMLVWGNFNTVPLSGSAAAVNRIAAITAQTLFEAVQVVNSADSVSKAATDRLGALREVAICAKRTRDDNCTASVIQGLNVWARTYVHTGNPINEKLLIPWIQSYDLVRPLLVSMYNASNISTWDNFTRRFITAGDAYLSGSILPDSYRTDRFYIRAFAAVTLNDAVEIANTMTMIEGHAPQNMFMDGTSYELRTRDSLQFHLRNLQNWVPMVAQVPMLLSSQTERLIEANVNFLQPYFQKTLVKIEFLNSTFNSDITSGRKAANATWDPSTANGLLFQAESVFPSVYNWTSRSNTSYTAYSLTNLLNGATKAYFTMYPLFPSQTSTAQVTTSRQTTTAQAVVKVFRVKVVLTFRIPAQVLISNTTLQRNIREAIAVSAGLARTEYLRVELIIRSALARRRRRVLLQSSNNSVIDAVINMPNASIANASASQITNTSLNSALADVGLPPVVGLQAPAVEEIVVAPDTTPDVIPVATPVIIANPSLVDPVGIWAFFASIFGVIVTFGVIGAACGGRAKTKKPEQGVPKREIPIPIRPPRMPDPEDEKHTRLPDRRWPNRDGYNRVPKEPKTVEPDAWDPPGKLVLPDLPRRPSKPEDVWDVPLP